MPFWIAVLVFAVVIGAASQAAATAWGREYVRQLPDSAFAVVEWSPKGKPVRRLPHHDATGALDLPHLCNAISRLPQVKWRNPANAEIARQHLSEHAKQVGQGACRPRQKSVY